MSALTNHQTERRLVADRGATAVEYSMLVALIAAIIVLTVQSIGVDVVGLWGSVDW